MQGIILAILAFLFGYKSYKILTGWQRVPPVSMRKAKSFYFDGGKTGILLLHGFTSSPCDVIGLGKYLAGRGYTVSGPLLPGHGTTPLDLANTTYHDWIKGAQKDLDELKQKCRKVFVGGVSMGGNLALLISNETDGVISMASPIRLKKHRLIRIVLPFLKRIKKYMYKYYKKEEIPMIQKKVHYRLLPIQKVEDLLKLMNLSRLKLPDIKKPVLVMQSLTDQKIDIKHNSEYIYSHLNSLKKLVHIPDSYHVFLNDKHKKQAYVEIEKFISQVEHGTFHTSTRTL